MSEKNEMPVKRRQSDRKRRKKISMSILSIKSIAIVAAVVVVVLALIFGVKSCSIKQNTPQNVVKSMVQFLYKGNTKKVKQCYDLENSDVDALDKEINAQMKYMQIHNSKKLEIVDCGVLYDSDKYSYVYITYNLLLEDDQKFPCVATYIVVKKDDKYFIEPTSKITDEMSNTATDKYTEFVNGREYKTYLTTYDTFIKKNPGYQDKISDKLR